MEYDIENAIEYDIEYDIEYYIVLWMNIYQTIITILDDAVKILLHEDWYSDSYQVLKGFPLDYYL